MNQLQFPSPSGKSIVKIWLMRLKFYESNVFTTISNRL